MKNILSSILLVLGIGALLIILGMYIERERIRKLPPQVTVRIVERPVEVPGRRDSTRAIPIQPNTARAAYVDSLILAARDAGHLEELNRKLSRKRLIVLKDTTSVVDSLGSFYTVRTDSLTFDPLSDQVTRITGYSGSVFKSTVTTVKTVLMEGRSWWRVLVEHFDFLGVVAFCFFILGVSV